MEKLREEFYQHLENKIIPFWKDLVDKENGGFIGYVDFDLNKDPYADKGSVLHSRILWFFSSAYNLLKNDELPFYANHAYEFLRDKFWDKEKGGFYWMTDYKGKVKDSRKHIYSQAFGIYALSEFYKAVKEKEVLELAKNLYSIIEEKCKDDDGYFEELDENWNPKENRILSEYNILAVRSMNSYLHVLEAYTNLYSIWKDKGLYEKIIWLLKIFKDKIYDSQSKHLKPFFDKDWKPIIDAISYGHDIEASWLMDESAKIVEENLRKEIETLNVELADSVLKEAWEKNSLINEKVRGNVDKSRVWWVQAEGVVGFFNAYQKTKDSKFLEVTISLWNFIKEYLVDKREKGEWFWKLDDNLKPVNMPEVEPWKCAYHNGRMCIEMIKRM